MNSLEGKIVVVTGAKGGLGSCVTESFLAAGATVIGVSHDSLEKLQKFSVSECRKKFAVAADTDQSVEKAYDAVLAKAPEYANRTSYVIAPNGTIIYTYTDLKPDNHVPNTLDALKAYSEKKEP